MKENKAFQAFDEKERNLIDSIQKDEWIEVRNIRELKKRALEYAEATIKKDRRMNIRISERDLRNLKRKALEEGIPYQTMVSMILHKYLTDKYYERSSPEGEQAKSRNVRMKSRSNLTLERTPRRQAGKGKG